MPYRDPEAARAHAREYQRKRRADDAAFRQYQRDAQHKSFEKKKRLDPERVAEENRRNSYRRNYGMTIERYDEMWASQNGLCAICREPETAVWRGQVKRLQIDHDHATGSIRQLLCRKCNNLLAVARESPVILTSAIAYLAIHA